MFFWATNWIPRSASVAKIARHAPLSTKCIVYNVCHCAQHVLGWSLGSVKSPKWEQWLRVWQRRVSVVLHFLSWNLSPCFLRLSRASSSSSFTLRKPRSISNIFTKTVNIFCILREWNNFRKTFHFCRWPNQNDSHKRLPPSKSTTKIYSKHFLCIIFTWSTWSEISMEVFPTQVVWPRRITSRSCLIAFPLMPEISKKHSITFQKDLVTHFKMHRKLKQLKQTGVIDKAEKQFHDDEELSSGW